MTNETIYIYIYIYMPLFFTLTKKYVGIVIEA